MRLTIIGNCGSGKSTLARTLSERFDIPHLHLDRLWFEAGGHLLKSDDAEGREKVRAYIRERVEEFIVQEDWVSDGWYPRVQGAIAARADRVIFLDIPLWRRLFNHLRRTFFSERHQELRTWDDIKFLSQIVRRTFTHGEQMKKFVVENRERVTTLRTYSGVEMFLENISTPHTARPY